MSISLIAAVAKNGVIGRGGQLPWHLSDDLRHFKKITMGRPVIMGRRTWESIGKALPGRLNIVVSRQPGFIAPGAVVVPSLEDALQQTKHAPEAIVIGGAQLYADALPLASVMYLTEIHDSFDGETRFPDWNRKEWREVEREDHAAASAGGPAYSFVRLERLASLSSDQVSG